MMKYVLLLIYSIYKLVEKQQNSPLSFKWILSSDEKEKSGATINFCQR